MVAVTRCVLAFRDTGGGSLMWREVSRRHMVRTIERVLTRGDYDGFSGRASRTALDMSESTPRC